MNQDVGLSRNNDSPTLPSGFNCCAIGLGARVFTQPGSKLPVRQGRRLRPDLNVDRTKTTKFRTFALGGPKLGLLRTS